MAQKVTEYHYTLSIAWNTSRGTIQGTYRGIFTVSAGERVTEESACETILTHVKREMAVPTTVQPTILFYRLVPNRTL